MYFLHVNGGAVIRKHLIFYGQVQGVGFRWRARQAAHAFGCTGWCRNEWDGTVVMEIQGEAEQINQVIQALAGGRYIEITGIDSKTIPVIEERSFRSEYY